MTPDPAVPRGTVDEREQLPCGGQFWNLTVPVRRGANTIRFIAHPQYNYDGKTIGVIYSGSGIGQPLRSDTAPNIDQIILAPFQLSGTRPRSS